MQTSSSSTPVRFARRRRKSCSTPWAACKQLKRAARSLTIGVGGCVPQLQGAAILDRADSGRPARRDHIPSARIPEHPGADRPRGEPTRRRPRPRAPTPSPCPRTKVAHSRPRRARTSPRWKGATTSAASASCPGLAGRRSAVPGGHRARWQAVVASRRLSGGHAPRTDCERYRHGGVRFADLLERVHEYAGAASGCASPHPILPMSIRFSQRPSGTSRSVCPYLHLPVQSGSDRILASMRRGYSAEGYRGHRRLLREHAPGSRPVQRRHRRVSRRNASETSRRRSTWWRPSGSRAVRLRVFAAPGNDGRASPGRRPRGREEAPGSSAERTPATAPDGQEPAPLGKDRGGARGCRGSRRTPVGAQPTTSGSSTSMGHGFAGWTRWCAPAS